MNILMLELLRGHFAPQQEIISLKLELPRGYLDLLETGCEHNLSIINYKLLMSYFKIVYLRNYFRVNLCQVLFFLEKAYLKAL